MRAVHSAAVGGNKMSAAERALGGASDEQMRVRPREDLNSIAWILWHVARAEDIFVNPVLADRSQVDGPLRASPMKSDCAGKAGARTAAFPQTGRLPRAGRPGAG